MHAKTFHLVRTPADKPSMMMALSVNPLAFRPIGKSLVRERPRKPFTPEFIDAEFEDVADADTDPITKTILYSRAATPVWMQKGLHVNMHV